MNDNYLTPVQLAEKLNIKVATLARWRYLGRGPRFCKVGGAVRYLPGDVDAWLEADQ